MRSRWVISPRPSMLGGRVSGAPRAAAATGSSAASSMVMIRSFRRHEPRQAVQERRLARAGFRPRLSTLHRAFTRPRGTRITPAGTAPLAESGPRAASAGCRTAPDRHRRAIQRRGGMIAFTRLPSASRASTIGLISSIRRPTWATMRAMILPEWAVVAEARLAEGQLPACASTVDRGSRRFTRMSVTPGPQQRFQRPEPQRLSITSSNEAVPARWS